MSSANQYDNEQSHEQHFRELVAEVGRSTPNNTKDTVESLLRTLYDATIMHFKSVRDRVYRMAAAGASGKELGDQIDLLLTDMKVTFDKGNYSIYNKTREAKLLGERGDGLEMRQFTPTPDWDFGMMGEFDFKELFDFATEALNNDDIEQAHLEKIAQKKKTVEVYNPFSGGNDELGERDLDFGKPNMPKSSAPVQGRKPRNLFESPSSPKTEATDRSETKTSSPTGIRLRPDILSQATSFNKYREDAYKNMTLASVPSIGDGEVEKNYNYFITKVGNEELLLAGHEQSVRYNRFTNHSKVQKHGFPLVFYWIGFNQYEIFFSRNEAPVAVNIAGKKFNFKHKFRGTYLRGKWDSRSRGVQLVGSLLYFQSGDSDLVKYNLDLQITSWEIGTNYEGELVATGVESFYADAHGQVWYVTISGQVIKNGSPHQKVLRDGSAEYEAGPDYTYITKHKGVILVTSYRESRKIVGFFLLNDTMGPLHSHSMEKQPSHVHVVLPIEVKEMKLFIVCTLYAITMLALRQDKLLSLTTNLVIGDNMINGIEYDDFTKSLFVADTRREIKVLKIQQ